jgi:nucleotide-binding universal stress UspA family protein
MLAISTTPKISIKKIVVPTDFTTASKAALDIAIAIATYYDSKVILVHAVEAAPQPHSERDTQHSEMHTLSEAEWQLRREANRCVDVDCERQLLRGTVTEVVEQFLAITQTDLIVVGTHGSMGFRRLLKRSDAEHIYRHVRCPVLAVGPSVRMREMTWNPKRIMLATDLQSDESRAVTYATALAQEHNAQLALLHVTLPASAPYPEDAEVVLRPYYESRLRQLIGDWRSSGGCGPDIWVEFEHDPVAGVIDVMTREPIDLLVLSVHPSAPWTLNFGHSAHRIVSMAPCPTLIVQRDL